LHQDVEDQALLVHRPPQPVPLPLDLQHHLVQMPLVTWSGAPPTQPVSEGLAELPAPPADRLVADRDPPLREDLLRVAVAHKEAEVQPHRVADDLAREAMPLVEGGRLAHRRVLRHPPANTPCS